MIHDHSDHGESNVPMNPCPDGVQQSFNLVHHEPSHLNSHLREKTYLRI